MDSYSKEGFESRRRTSGHRLVDENRLPAFQIPLTYDGIACPDGCGAAEAVAAAASFRMRW